MSDRVLVISGAGLSAESGIPTFRDSNGLWYNHDPKQIAHASTWKKNFDLVHRFYNDRRRDLGTVQPNAAHKLLAQWEQDLDLIHFTQNIDDLLERAGATNVVHLHGRLTEMRCEACGTVWSIDYNSWNTEDSCVKCVSRRGVRPNVVFFDDLAPEYAKLYKALKQVGEQDVIVVVGTSGEVLPINSFVFDKKCKKALVYLESNDNINEDYFDVVYRMPVTAACDQLDKFVRDHLAGRK